MKRYGYSKETDFTRKQISVIYVKAKSGVLKVEKWFMSELYNLADYIGYDDNGIIEWREMQVKEILKVVFENDIKKAQELIGIIADDWFNSSSIEKQIKCDRMSFVA